MKPEQFCGLATITALMLVAALIILQPRDWVMIMVNVVGWTISFAAAIAAWSRAQRQISIAEAQVKQANDSIADVKRQTLQEAHNTLKNQIFDLKVAAADIRNLAARFPPTQSSTFASALLDVREQALDLPSHSALSAPFGYGLRAANILRRLEGLGLRLEQMDPGAYRPNVAMQNKFEPWVKEVALMLEPLAQAIDGEISRRSTELAELNARLAHQENRHSAASRAAARCPQLAATSAAASGGHTLLPQHEPCTVAEIGDPSGRRSMM